MSLQDYICLTVLLLFEKFYFFSVYSINFELWQKTFKYDPYHMGHIEKTYLEYL